MPSSSDAPCAFTGPSRSKWAPILDGGGGECLPLVRSIFTFRVHVEQAPSLCSRMVIRMIVKTTGFISITYINTFYVTSLHGINPFNLPNDLIG